MHVEDLIKVEEQLGYRYQIAGSKIEHYQWICPPCRRSMLALAQGRLWSGQQVEFGAPAELAPRPTLGNPGANQGPLGVEDERNFHP